MIIYLKTDAPLAGDLWKAGTRLELVDKLARKAIADGIASANPIEPAPEKEEKPQPAKKRGRPKKTD